MVRRFVFPASAAFVAAVLGLGIAALAFAPPQSQSPPSQSVGEPTSAPSTDKSSSPAPIASSLSPTPATAWTNKLPLRTAAMPGVIDVNNWRDKLLSDELTLIITIDPESKEGVEALDAVLGLPVKAYAGRLTVQIELPKTKEGGEFYKKYHRPGDREVRKVAFDLCVHRYPKQFAAITEVVTKKMAYDADAFYKKIAADDGHQLLDKNDLNADQLSRLTADAREKWLKGQVTSEALRLWLEVVGKEQLALDLKPGRPCLPELNEKSVLRVWWVDADTDYGRQLHIDMAKDPRKTVPEDAPGLIVFQMDPSTFDPTGPDQRRWGPYRLDCKKSMVTDLTRLLKDEVGARESTTNLMLTQAVATPEPAPAPAIKK